MNRANSIYTRSTPHDVPPHMLAHELGHVLGFPDVYLGYRDLGADGFQVREPVVDPDDLMAARGPARSDPDTSRR